LYLLEVTSPVAKEPTRGNSDLIPEDDYYLVNGLSGLLFGAKYYSEAAHLYGKLSDADRLRVVAFIPLTHDIKWSSKIMSVKAYVERHDSLPTINNDDKGIQSIARWLANQRVRLTDDESSMERLAVLDTLAPTWNPERDRWNSRFAEVCAFRAAHGRLPGYAEDNGTWLGTQRGDSKRNSLIDHRRELLDTHLPEWRGESADVKWVKKLDALTVFIANNGRFPRRDADGESAIANWLGTQSGLVKKELLGDEKTRLLTDGLLAVITPEMRVNSLPEFLGFDQWEETLRQVVSYVDEHGDLPRKSGGKLAASLSGWMTRQRKLGDEALTSEQIKALDDSLPDWRDTAKTRWEQNFDQCIAYFVSHGSVPSASSDDPETQLLGRWFQNQKSALKPGGNPEREDAFDTHLPGWRDGITAVRIEDWEDKLNAVVAFVDKRGKYPSLKTEDPLEKSLAGWVYKQRDRSKDGRMTDEQRSALNALLPLWMARQDAAWEEKLNVAVGYCQKTGMLPRKKHGEYASVSVWLRSQRSQHRKGELRSDRISKLDSAIPGWSDEIL
jgi:hypothetical protein